MGLYSLYHNAGPTSLRLYSCPTVPVEELSFWNEVAEPKLYSTYLFAYLVTGHSSRCIIMHKWAHGLMQGSLPQHMKITWISHPVLMNPLLMLCVSKELALDHCASLLWCRIDSLVFCYVPALPWRKGVLDRRVRVTVESLWSLKERDEPWEVAAIGGLEVSVTRVIVFIHFYFSC
jgi:hypothetical protein